MDGEDGVEYTLDIDQQEIRFSDGRVLILDPEQTSMAAATFHGTLVADAEASDLQNLPDPNCTNPDPAFCGIEAQSASGQSDPSSTVLWRVASVGSETPNWRSAKRQQGRRRSNPDNASIASSADPCTDVANAALPKTLEYKTQRNSFMKDVWAVAIAEGVNLAKRFMPRGSAAAADFVNEVADHLHARTSMSVLAFTWNSYSCGSRNVTAGPIFVGGGGGGGAGNFTCHYETWEISFTGWDGPWYPITVTVCSYNQT